MLCTRTATTPTSHRYWSAGRRRGRPTVRLLRAHVDLVLQLLRDLGWLRRRPVRGPFNRRTANPVLLVGTRFDPAWPIPQRSGRTVNDLLPDSVLLTVEVGPHIGRHPIRLHRASTVSDYLLERHHAGPRHHMRRRRRTIRCPSVLQPARRWRPPQAPDRPEQRGTGPARTPSRQRKRWPPGLHRRCRAALRGSEGSAMIVATSFLSRSGRASRLWGLASMPEWSAPPDSEPRPVLGSCGPAESPTRCPSSSAPVTNDGRAIVTASPSSPPPCKWPSGTRSRHALIGQLTGHDASQLAVFSAHLHGANTGPVTAPTASSIGHCRQRPTTEGVTGRCCSARSGKGTDEDDWSDCVTRHGVSMNGRSARHNRRPQRCPSRVTGGPHRGAVEG